MTTRNLRIRMPLLALVGILLAALLGAGWLLADQDEEQPSATRQAEVAAKGRSVMPFDLDRTTHVFQDMPDGGRQTVTADDPGDREQVARIQDHLQQEAAAFSRGDFTDPASIHGRDMPGLAELKSGASRIDVRYRALPNGAELRYTTGDPILVAGIHSWFKAQRMDHGSHAEGH